MDNFLLGWIILSIVSFVVLYTAFKDELDDFADWASVIVTSAGIGIVAMLTVAVILLATISEYEHYDNYDYTVNIYSLERGERVSGQFFLGSGVIEGKQMYYYFEQDGEGYKLGQTEARGLQIVEKDIEPNVEVWKRSDINSVRAWLDGKWFKSISHEDAMIRYGRTYVKRIVVPKGTIIKQYKVN